MIQQWVGGRQSAVGLALLLRSVWGEVSWSRPPAHPGGTFFS